VRFEGTELLGLDKRALNELRGNAIAMIFQEPMSSLNPAFTIGEQIVEGCCAIAASAAPRRRRARRDARAGPHPGAGRALPRPPAQALGRHAPARDDRDGAGLRSAPLIADEPTTALDVTIQAQILELMRTLQQETGTAVILITHDLGVVAEVADDVVVMYAGKVVERAPVGALFEAPQHPYAVGLLGSIPRLDADAVRLASIDGQVPSPFRPEPGCSFAPRCPVRRCALPQHGAGPARPRRAPPRGVLEGAARPRPARRRARAARARGGGGLHDRAAAPLGRCECRREGVRRVEERVA
jgi:oligopeptide/dipeptide ABC transporter ATP-binding protein